jgi:polyphosphate kinase
VKVDLIVRGICGLIPGVKGLSENIRVRSLLGRFLEHSRVYYFKNSPVGENTYLGSPDWMPRNFFRRVEVVFPVEEAKMQEEIVQTMEDILSDNSMATELRQNGKYVAAPKRRKKAFTVQDHLISLSQEKQSLTLEKVRSGRAPGESKNQGKTN